MLLSMSQGSVTQGSGKSSHPYSKLPEYAFWNRSVAGVPPFAVDPVVAVPFRISPADEVATAGSCFAQNISRALGEKGFRYFVTETAPPGMSRPAAAAANYGTFSARYGNIYTTRQLVQLFDRAYGTYNPSVSVWLTKGGGYVDPFRPRIQPDGFASEADLIAERTRHFACVRRLFESLNVFVFTLGLTEGWEHRGEQAALPLAPGVAGGEWDAGQYEFRNYNVEDVQRDLTGFIARLRSVNPSSRIILTVSPVPLVATYEARHVLASTCLSKSVLRVAAEVCASSHSNVCYFPAYEIITGPHSGGRYFEDDLRSVTQAGVNHVMRVFFSHFAQPLSERQEARSDRVNYLEEELNAVRDIICDEEALNN